MLRYFIAMTSFAPVVAIAACSEPISDAAPETTSAYYCTLNGVQARDDKVVFDLTNLRAYSAHTGGPLEVVETTSLRGIISPVALLFPFEASKGRENLNGVEIDYEVFGEDTKLVSIVATTPEGKSTSSSVVFDISGNVIAYSVRNQIYDEIFADAYIFCGGEKLNFSSSLSGE